MHILYVLRMKDLPYFKFGITSGMANLERVKNLHRIYNFSLPDSYLIKCEKAGVIRSFENTIKFGYEFGCPEQFKGRDGATELRPLDIWDNVIQQIEFQAKHLSHLNIEIQKGVSDVITVKKEE